MVKKKKKLSTKIGIEENFYLKKNTYKIPL